METRRPSLFTVYDIEEVIEVIDHLSCHGNRFVIFTLRYISLIFWVSEKS